MTGLYVCSGPNCHRTWDRDINAAINILLVHRYRIDNNGRVPPAFDRALIIPPAARQYRYDEFTPDEKATLSLEEQRERGEADPVGVSRPFLRTRVRLPAAAEDDEDV